MMTFIKYLASVCVIGVVISLVLFLPTRLPIQLTKRSFKSSKANGKIRQITKCRSVIVSDFDSDSCNDMLLSNDSTLFFFKGREGHFKVKSLCEFSQNCDYQQLAKHDINGDGAADFLYLRSLRHPLAIDDYANDFGLFCWLNQSLISRRSFQGDLFCLFRGANLRSFCVGHFNGDNWADVCLLSQNELSVYSLVRDKRKGGFVRVKNLFRYTFNVEASPFVVLCNDINGDGLTDILVGGCGVRVVFLNSKSGCFVQQKSGCWPSMGSSVLSMQLHDIDKDGDLDIIEGNCGIGYSPYNPDACVCPVLSTNRILLNDGTGRFSVINVDCDIGTSLTNTIRVFDFSKASFIVFGNNNIGFGSKGETAIYRIRSTSPLTINKVFSFSEFLPTAVQDVAIGSEKVACGAAHIYFTYKPFNFCPINSGLCRVRVSKEGDFDFRFPKTVAESIDF